MVKFVKKIIQNYNDPSVNIKYQPFANQAINDGYYV
jgi:hypothetical protein